MVYKKIKVVNRLSNNNYSSIGIGSMIVFISMVLVAGIAASVLIQTSNDLETQSLKTGHETRDEVSTGIGVVQIIGQYNSRNVSGTFYSRFHNMSIMVTSRSGGSGINLDEVALTLANETKKVVLSWNNKFALSPSADGLFSTPTLFDLNASEFGIIVVEDGDDSCTSLTPVINKGDKALLTVNLTACFNGLTYRSNIRGMVISEHGAPGVFLFRTPASTSRTVVELM